MMRSTQPVGTSSSPPAGAPESASNQTRLAPSVEQSSGWSSSACPLSAYPVLNQYPPALDQPSTSCRSPPSRTRTQIDGSCAGELRVFAGCKLTAALSRQRRSATVSVGLPTLLVHSKTFRDSTLAITHAMNTPMLRTRLEAVAVERSTRTRSHDCSFLCRRREPLGATTPKSSSRGGANMALAPSDTGSSSRHRAMAAAMVRNDDAG